MRKCCGIRLQKCVAERRGTHAAGGRGQPPRECAAGNESDWLIFIPLYGLKGRVFGRIYRGYGRHDYLLEENTYRLLWTDCVEFEIVQVPVNWSTSAAVVYCSMRVLSQKEKENFFWYHKNDFAHVQYFQYSDEAIFQEFLHCVPERARNYLEAEALVLGLPGE